MATTVNDARAVGIAETVRTDRNLWRPAIAALLHPGRDVRSGVRGPDTDVDRHVADRSRALIGSTQQMGTLRGPIRTGRLRPASAIRNQGLILSN